MFRSFLEISHFSQNRLETLFPVLLFCQPAQCDMARPVTQGLTGAICWLWESAILADYGKKKTSYCSLDRVVGLWLRPSCPNKLLGRALAFWKRARELNREVRVFAGGACPAMLWFHMGREMDWSGGFVRCASHGTWSSMATRTLEQWSCFADQTLGFLDSYHRWDFLWMSYSSFLAESKATQRWAVDHFYNPGCSWHGGRESFDGRL